MPKSYVRRRSLRSPKPIISNGFNDHLTYTVTVVKGSLPVVGSWHGICRDLQKYVKNKFAHR